MPLCAYFVSGKCNYGTKCHNSHVDVQAMVQAEMKAALNGKQWPLSTFSPFKDEPSLPDLLEDQSFEEVRWNFLLAKVENRLPQFQEDFKRMTGMAFDKMSKLTMNDVGVKKYLVDIYGLNGKKTRQMNSTQSTFGNPSIFDRLSSNAVTEASSSVFGGGTTTSAAAGFGGHSVFAGSTAFGGGQTAAPQKSIFGQQQPPVAQSIFSQNQQQQQTNSLFKLPQLSGVQSSSGGNIFAQPQQPSSSAFGSQQTNSVASSIFGGSFSNNSNTQPMSTETLFGGSHTNSVFGQNQNQSAFGQNPQNSAFGQTSSVFGQPQQQQQQSQFGQQSVIAPPAFAPQVAPQGIFGQVSQSALPTVLMQQPQQQQSNVFGKVNPPQQAQNIFQTVSQSPAPQSAFGTVQAPPQPAPVSSVFATASPYEAQSSLPARTSTFPQATNSFAPADSPHKLPHMSYLYSKLEDLTPEQLEAFKADTFEIGKIPTVPPPVELCGF